MGLAATASYHLRRLGTPSVSSVPPAFAKSTAHSALMSAIENRVPATKACCCSCLSSSPNVDALIETAGQLLLGQVGVDSKRRACSAMMDADAAVLHDVSEFGVLD